MDNSATPRMSALLSSASSGIRYTSWRAHAALVASVVGYIGLSAWQSTPDANIGLGLGLLALGAVGAPWSLPLLASEQFTIDSGVFIVTATSGALINLALHAVALGRRKARTVRRR